MIPILLKGHERSITYVTYNHDGDLLFTCSKDSFPTVWWASTGERLGTYNGHSGTVWQCAVTRTYTMTCAASFELGIWSIQCCSSDAGDSKYMLTGSADNSAKLWDVATGECLFTWEHHGYVHRKYMCHCKTCLLRCN